MPSVTADNTNKAPATTAGAASLPTDIDSDDNSTAAASKNVTTTAAREKELATRREGFNSRKYSLSESDDEEEEGGAIDKDLGDHSRMDGMMMPTQSHRRKSWHTYCSLPNQEALRILT